jgi:glutathione peroxidase
VFAKSQGAAFPVYDKVKACTSVPDYQHPLFRFIEEVAGATLKWNFEKYLFDKDGKLVRHYGPRVNPLSFDADIEALLEVP